MGVVSASDDDSLKIWTVLPDGDGSEQGARSDLQGKIFHFSPDGNRILGRIGKRSQIGQIYDATSREVLHTLEGHTAKINTMNWSLDGTKIVSASNDSIRLWDPSTGELLHALEGETRVNSDCCFSPDGVTIAVASWDNKLRIWNTTTVELEMVLEGHTHWVQGCSFSADGHYLASTSDDGALRIWDAVSGRMLHVFPQTHQASGFYPATPVFSPDGKLIATCVDKETIQLWDMESGQTAFVVSGSYFPRPACVYSPDGKLLATSHAEEVFIWDAANGKKLRTFGSRVWDVRQFWFTSDGLYLVAVSFNKWMRMWEVSSGNLLGEMIFPGSLNTLDLHPTRLQFVCNDAGGNPYHGKWIGVDPGPSVTTATSSNGKLILFCPACQKEHLITEGQLGKAYTCPTLDCGLSLKLNPFVIQMTQQHHCTTGGQSNFPLLETRIY